jgi:hypothetical protein
MRHWVELPLGVTTCPSGSVIVFKQRHAQFGNYGLYAVVRGFFKEQVEKLPNGSNADLAPFLNLKYV